MTTLERRHDTFLDLAATALDFGLSRAEAAELDAHLAGCPACARTAGSLRADAAVLRHLAELTPGRRVDAAVAAAIAGRNARPASQRLLVLVAATALLLVALLGVAAAGAFLQRSRPAVVVPVPSPLAVVPYPSGSPAPSGTPTWRQGTVPPMFTGSTAVPAAIAAGPDRLALVGAREFSDLQTPAGGTAGAWRSADGITWERGSPTSGLAVGNDVLVDEPVLPGLLDVAWGSAGYVAAGLLHEGGQQVGGAWVSSDGLAWSRAQLPNQALARPAAVAWTGSGYVMVGVSREKSAPRAAVWLSTDGRSWQRVPDAPAFDIGGYITYLGGSAGSGGLADVAALADGSVVAVGRTCTGTTSADQQSICKPLVLRSPDGQTWTRAYEPATAGPGLSAVAASGSLVVAVAGGQGQSTDPASIVVGDAAGWRAVAAPGIPRLDHVVAFGGGFLALATATGQITLWTSPDGAAWTEMAGVPQPPAVTAFQDLDVAALGSGAVIAGSAEVSSAAGFSAFSIVGGNLPVPAPASDPVPSSSPTAISTPGPALFPSSGAVRITPGPDGGLYVVVNGTASGSVVALLDAAGSIRPGWPIRLNGWDCDAENGPRVPVVAGDGSLRLVCFSSAGAAPVTRAFAFDPSGGLLRGWPVDLPPNVWEQPRLVGDRLVVAVHESSDQDPYPGAYWLVEVAPDGTSTTGARIQFATAASVWPVVIGPAGVAYRFAGHEITAFDTGGPRAGWPVTLTGDPSAPAFDPSGRLVVAVASGSGGSRLVTLTADGAVVDTSDALPVAGASGWSGAGPASGAMAPLVAVDGTASVIDEAGGRAVVHAVDAAGTPATGWPYTGPSGLQWQGTCGLEVTGCGVWRALPALGPTGILYLPLGAPDAQIGGTLAAVGRDGAPVKGWPMHLARRGAEFWSVVVGPDGVVFALAVEPEAGGKTSATIVASTPAGKVIFRTTIVDPTAAGG